MARCKFKTKKVEVNLLPQDYEYLKILSAEADVSMSEFLRILVRKAAEDKSKSNDDTARDRYVASEVRVKAEIPELELVEV
jgi:hypothetical protein